MVRSSDPSYSFSTRQMSSELPWDLEFKSTYMPTTPRCQLHRIGFQPAATRLLAYITEIESWMSSNRLKLNASLKTEFIWIGTRQQLSKVKEEVLMVCGQSVTPTVRDLVVFIDRELTMEAHVSNTVRGCTFNLI